MNKLLVVIFLPSLILAQSVKGTFSPTSDYTYAFLYNATPDGANYVNRGKLDENGSFEITLDSTAAPGIYKIVYAIPPEENNFDFIYDGKETVAFNFNKDLGLEFVESDENKLWDSYLKSMEMVNQTISNYYSQGKEDEQGFESIFKVLKDTQMAYEESAKGKMVSAFITANRPYIPMDYEDIKTYSVNLKQHYLSEIDFSNYILQCSSFLVDRVNAYVFDIVMNPNNSTYKNHVDDVSKAIGDDANNIKTILMEILWQRFARSGNDELANYIADQYLIELAKLTNDKVLEGRLTAYKKTSIGTVAPDFEIGHGIEDNSNITSLLELEVAEYYLLIFWSSGCSHCLDELPKIKEIVGEKSNFKVVAFGLEDNTFQWSNEIKKYPNFIHTVGLGKWKHPVVKTYGVDATPSYFLLDTSKKILAKPFTFEDLKSLIDNL